MNGMARLYRVKLWWGFAARPRQILSWLAVAVTLITVTAILLAPGYSSKKPRSTVNKLWVTDENTKYGLLNIETMQIEAVGTVEKPGKIVQDGQLTFAVNSGYTKAWVLNPAAMQTLNEKTVTKTGVTLPVNTVKIEARAGTLALLTKNGSLHYTHTKLAACNRKLEQSGLTNADTTRECTLQALKNMRALPGVNVTEFAVSPAGDIAVYSANKQHVRLYTKTAKKLGKPQKTGKVGRAQISFAGKDWVLFDSETKTLWRKNSEPVTVAALAGSARIQAVTGLAGSSQANEKNSAGSRVNPGDLLIADTEGLIKVEAAGKVSRIVKTRGNPATPLRTETTAHAAWFTQTEGKLLNLKTTVETGPAEKPGKNKKPLESRLVHLQYEAGAKPSEHPQAVFQTNGDNTILQELDSATVWSIPAGETLPHAQWQPPKQQNTVTGKTPVEAADAQPPTARPDSFGVRADTPVRLDVLMNDSDPNRADLLTIEKTTLNTSALPASYGTVDIQPGGQALIFTPTRDARGTASFTYTVTDGIKTSNPATVTLTVHANSVNTAPQWCPQKDCTRVWPNLELHPGGTATIPVTAGWEDPEGDPLTLSAVKTVPEDQTLRVNITATGELAIKHTVPAAVDTLYAIQITVSDIHGAANTRELTVHVTVQAEAHFTPEATTLQVGESKTLQVTELVQGGSGIHTLETAKSRQAETLQVTKTRENGEITVRALAAGVHAIELVYRDSINGKETSGTIQINAEKNPATKKTRTLPPQNIFLLDYDETTLNVTEAVPPGYWLQNPHTHGQTQASAIKHAELKISANPTGENPTGVNPTGVNLGGALRGTVNYTLTNGKQTLHGTVRVFKAPEQPRGTPIAKDDTLTVRAKQLADVPVLQNDSAPLGHTLLLDPQVTGSGTPGELAFASGNTLRYLAPRKPGVYKIRYESVVKGHPQNRDTAELRIRVIDENTANTAPQPRPLTAIVAPGETTRITVPHQNTDAEGDTVHVTAVKPDTVPTAPKPAVQPQNTAQILASVTNAGREILVQAAQNASPGTSKLKYTVRDANGLEAEEKLSITIRPQTAGRQVTQSFLATNRISVTAKQKEPVTLYPLQNTDPQNKNTQQQTHAQPDTTKPLHLTEVKPLLPGGENNPNYMKEKQRLNLENLKTGKIGVYPANTPGTSAYRYTAKTTDNTTRIEGLIIVRTTTRPDRQAPQIADTIIDLAERKQLETNGINIIENKINWSNGNPNTLKTRLVDTLNTATQTTNSTKTATENTKTPGEKPQKVKHATLESIKVSGIPFTLNNHTIHGKYIPEGAIIPFTTTGPDYTGTITDGYGMLIIPPIDELTLKLKPETKPLQVDEGETLKIDIARILDTEEKTDLADDNFQTLNPQAKCRAVNKTKLQYSAGHQAPWEDICLIKVKLQQQKRWTSLPIPVTIRPNTPQLTLAKLSQTIPPGETINLDLRDLAQWQGGQKGDSNKLQFTISASKKPFKISQNHTKIKITADADATPHTQTTVPIKTVGTHKAETTLNLQVGHAKTAHPQGGEQTLECAIGENCETNLTTAPGTYDPFAGKTGGGLHATQITDTGNCTAANITITRNKTAKINWIKPHTIGQICGFTYTIKDAQNREGTGTLTLLAKGKPPSPNPPQQTAYTANTVTFTVQLATTPAHPEIHAVQLGWHTQNSETATQTNGTTNCATQNTTTYTCTATNLETGIKHSFWAQTINSQGISTPTNKITAWAYIPPNAPNIQAKQQANPENTDPYHGKIHLTVQATKDTANIQIQIDGNPLEKIPGNNIQKEYTLETGPHTITAIPESTHQAPQQTSQQTGTPAHTQITVTGAPTIQNAKLTYDLTKQQAEITHTPLKNAQIHYALNRQGTKHNCNNTNQNNTQNQETPNPTNTSIEPDPHATPIFTALTPGQSYHGTICATTIYGKTLIETNTITIPTADENPKPQQHPDTTEQP